MSDFWVIIYQSVHDNLTGRSHGLGVLRGLNEVTGRYLIFLFLKLSVWLTDLNVATLTDSTGQDTCMVTQSGNMGVLVVR